MGGQQEVSLDNVYRFISWLELVTKSYAIAVDQSTTPDPRMRSPEGELRLEGLIGTYELDKKRLDRVHALDVSLINAFLLSYGKDLTNVNIHTGPYAEEITHKAGADALTSGKDIYFSSGSFSPQTEEGKALLLHELEHVEQSRNGQRHVYKEDIEKAEKQAYSMEAFSQSSGEDHELFDRLKQGGVVFKDPELTDGLDAKDKELEAYGSQEPKKYIKYFSNSGRVHELSWEEYHQALNVIRERLDEYFDQQVMYCSEEEKIASLQRLVNLFEI